MVDLLVPVKVNHKHTVQRHPLQQCVFNLVTKVKKNPDNSVISRWILLNMKTSISAHEERKEGIFLFYSGEKN